MREPHRARAEQEEERLAGLVKRSRDGDRKAWGELWLALDPLLQSIAGRRGVTGHLARCPDERSNIVVRVMGELCEDGFRRLVELGEHLEHRDGRYRRWLARVAINSAISYGREHPEYLGAVEGGGERWASLSPLSEQLEDELEDERPEPIPEIDARRILAGAREELEPAQLDALCRWLRGEDFDEIAGALGLDGGDAATRLVRSALRRLRSRYAALGTGTESAGSELVAGAAATCLAVRIGALPGTVLLAARAGCLDQTSRNKRYHWEYTLDGGLTFLPMPSTRTAKTSIANLTPLTTVGFRVSIRAPGRPPEAWSPVVSVTVR